MQISQELEDSLKKRLNTDDFEYIKSTLNQWKNQQQAYEKNIAELERDRTHLQNQVKQYDSELGKTKERLEYLQGLSEKEKKLKAKEALISAKEHELLIKEANIKATILEGHCEAMKESIRNIHELTKTVFSNNNVKTKVYEKVEALPSTTNLIHKRNGDSETEILPVTETTTVTEIVS
jgi:chromosome segregation ATPase